MKGTLWIGVLGLVAWSCSGEPPLTRAGPEDCLDGIDNDEDGLVDCDDTDCGGLVCQTTGFTTPESGANLPVAEILYEPAECCNFDFSSDDCPQKLIGSLTFINRSDSNEGVIDLSCNLIGGTVAAIHWQLEGAAKPIPFLTDEDIAPQTSMKAESFFVCGGVNQSFTTTCQGKIVVGSEQDEVSFDITATAIE